MIATSKQAGATDVSGSVTRSGQTLTQVGAGMTLSPNYGALRFYYVPAPTIGTSDVAFATDAATGCRIVAWVLNGAHQTTVPTYLQGTNGTTITWSWTGVASGGLIAAAAKRAGAPLTWTNGGGLSSDSVGTVSSFAGAALDGVAAGSVITSGTTATPTWTFSGGESGSNVFGSVYWPEASGSPPPTALFRDYFITG